MLVPGIRPGLSSADTIANYNLTLHSNSAEWARNGALYCRSGSGLWANLDRDFTCYDWLVSVSQLPKNAQPGWTPSGPRDMAEASGLSIQDLSSRLTTGWEPSGPRDMVKAYNPSAWELMQRQAQPAWTPSGSRDMAKASSLSVWELMQRQAQPGWAPSGPRDIAGTGGSTGAELVQKLANSSMRNKLLYDSRVQQQAAGAPAPPAKAEQPYSY